MNKGQVVVLPIAAAEDVKVNSAGIACEGKGGVMCCIGCDDSRCQSFKLSLTVTGSGECNGVIGS